MKGLALLLLIAIMGAIMLISPAHAATNLVVNASIPTGTLLQGQVVATDITVKNNENFPVRIYKIGVHYDWMPEGTFYALDLGNNYVQIESNMAGRPGQILLSCDKNASVGYHQYKFKLDITRYDTTSAAWVSDVVVSPDTNIYVDSPLRQQALSLIQSANDTLASARAMNYSSNGGKQDLYNATNYLNDGWSAYNANDFTRTMNDSYAVTLSVNSARGKESTFQSSRNATLESISIVNTKITMLSGSGSDEVRRLVNESLAHLQQASYYMNAEDFTTAKSQVMIADTTSDRALNAQYMYQMQSNETDTDRTHALASIQDAWTAINQSDGLISSSAGSLMNEARDKLEAAIADYNLSSYRIASNEASVAAALAQQAMKSDADYNLQQAREKISSVGSLKSPSARDELNESRTAYNDSLSQYAQQDYKNAIVSANRAFYLANNTTMTDRAWKEQNPLNTIVPGFEALACLVALVFVAYTAGRRRE